MVVKKAELRAQLTPRQIQLLKAIWSFQSNHYYSPTFAELSSVMGISRSTVFEHIGELRKKGMLASFGGKARCLELSCKALNLLESFESDASEFSCESDSGIPLAGRVAAGLPIEAIENMDNISLSSYFAAGDDTFALEVTGESMVEAGIMDGDVAICRRSSVAEDGQLVIAIVDDDSATLKRFYREQSRARLEPANSSFEPLYSENCRIEAVVVGLVRRF